MMNLLRDWWRGWSDEDLASVLTKVEVHGLNPGAFIPVTVRELRAHQVYVGGRCRFQCVDAGELSR